MSAKTKLIDPYPWLHDDQVAASWSRLREPITLTLKVQDALRAAKEERQ